MSQSPIALSLSSQLFFHRRSVRHRLSEYPPQGQSFLPFQRFYFRTVRYFTVRSSCFNPARELMILHHLVVLLDFVLPSSSPHRRLHRCYRRNRRTKDESCSTDTIIAPSSIRYNCYSFFSRQPSPTVSQQIQWRIDTPASLWCCSSSL